MQPIAMINREAPERQTMPIQVVMECRKADIGKWVDHIWDIVGVLAGRVPGNPGDETPVRVDRDSRQYLVGGLNLRLHADECESYYHNLMSPAPRCYVVAHVEDQDDRPQPFLVSMSFDEAHAYLEGEDEIYAVTIPPEVYQWTEAFVLSYYAPEKRRKRKRVDWREAEGRR